MKTPRQNASLDQMNCINFLDVTEMTEPVVELLFSVFPVQIIIPEHLSTVEAIYALT